MVGMKMKSILHLSLLGAAYTSIACSGGDSGDGTNDPVVDPPESGDIVTWAGDGTQGNNGDGHPPSESWINQPMEIEFDHEGRAYIVDWNNHALRMVGADETLTTLIGQTIPGDWPCQIPGDATNCLVPLDQTIAANELALNHPMDVVVDHDGTVYFAAWHNFKIERYDAAARTVDIVSGQMKPGFAGDGMLAAGAVLNFPSSIVVDSSGALLLSDERNNRIRRIAPEPDRTITTVVAFADMRQLPSFAGEGTPALESRLALAPYNEMGGADNPPPGGGLALDSDGNLYVADTYNQCIRRVAAGADGLIGQGESSEEIITTIAGVCGEANGGYSGDDGPALEARLLNPHDLEIGPDGALYVADAGNHVVRRIDLGTGIISTVAGTGDAGFAGDNGPATEAQLRTPYGIDFDTDGNLYIADTMNNRIRQVLK